MPKNMLPSRMPIQTRVVRAFGASGALKAGTPLEMASVPVMAEQPWAKARRIRKMLRPSAPNCRTDGGGV
jgi:hypothetical protein